VNHTRFPKEDHLPDWARRDNKVTKGDRVDYIRRRKSRWTSILNVASNVKWLPGHLYFYHHSRLEVYCSLIHDDSCPSGLLELFPVRQTRWYCIQFTNRIRTATDLPVFVTLDSTLHMAAVCSSDRLVPTYQTARYHNPNPVVRIFTAAQTPYLTNFIFVSVYCAVAQLVEALPYNLEDRRFNFRWCHWNCSFT